MLPSTRQGWLPITARRAWLVAMSLACALGCGRSARFDRINGLRPVVPSHGAPEKVFEVQWWARTAGEALLLPYRPVETAEPEHDGLTGVTYVGTTDGKVRAFASGGKPVWEVDAGSAVLAGPVLAGSRLYAGTEDGRLVAFEASGGKKLWEYAAGEELVTRPVIAGGMVFVVSSADTLFAVDASTGAWKWQYRRDPPGGLTARGEARPLVHAGRLYAGFADGSAVALDPKDGSVAWVRSLASPGGQFSDADAGPVANAAGRVFFASLTGGVFALDATTGTVAWSRPIANVTALAVSASGEVVYAGGEGEVVALTADRGIEGWRVTLGSEQWVSAVATAGGWLLISTGRGPLALVDAATGRLHRHFDPGHGVWARASVVGPGEALVLSNRGLLYDLALAKAPSP